MLAVLPEGAVIETNFPQAQLDEAPLDELVEASAGWRRPAPCTRPPRLPERTR